MDLIMIDGIPTNEESMTVFEFLVATSEGRTTAAKRPDLSPEWETLSDETNSALDEHGLCEISDKFGDLIGVIQEKVYRLGFVDGINFMVEALATRRSEVACNG